MARKTGIRIVALCLLLSQASFAEDMGLYIGGSLGYANQAAQGRLPDTSFGDISYRLDDQTTSWKGFAGLQLLPFVAVEASYTDFGEVGSASASTDTNTWAAYAVGKLPLGPLELFGKVGVHAYDSKFSAFAQDVDAVIKRDNSDQDIAWGLGAGLQLLDVTVRAEYEQYEVKGLNDLSIISVGASYSF